MFKIGDRVVYVKENYPRCVKSVRFGHRGVVKEVYPDGRVTLEGCEVVFMAADLRHEKDFPLKEDLSYLYDREYNFLVHAELETESVQLAGRGNFSAVRLLARELLGLSYGLAVLKKLKNERFVHVKENGKDYDVSFTVFSEEDDK